MTKDEALKLALEALKCAKATTSTPGNFLFFEEAITAIKEALAQPEQDYPENFIHALAFHTAISDLEPEQEPVAFDVQKALRRAYHLGQSYWADADSESYAANKRSDKHRQNFDELCEEALAYTTPPQRTWVGLTLEELSEIYNQTGWDMVDSWGYERAIEAKLKEKNNG